MQCNNSSNRDPGVWMSIIVNIWLEDHKYKSSNYKNVIVIYNDNIILLLIPFVTHLIATALLKL